MCRAQDLSGELQVRPNNITQQHALCGGVGHHGVCPALESRIHLARALLARRVSFSHLDSNRSCLFFVFAAPPPNYSVLPALERIHRFVITGTLQQSLFGVVKLAFDRLTKRQVAIKISRRDLSQASQARSGVTVLENVKREAQVLRYMMEHRSAAACQKGLGAVVEPKLPSVPNISNDFSQMDLSEGVGGGSGSSSNPSDADAVSGVAADSPTKRLAFDESSQGDDASSIKSSMESDMLGSSSSAATKDDPSLCGDDSICEGALYICDLVEELEDEFFHYLISTFAPGGDLYSILTTFPQHRLTEPQARFVFRQVVLGVKHLHDNHIAHLDLSLENICLDANENCRIIDFGVAALHPLTPSTNSSANFFQLSGASPISTLPFQKSAPGQSVLQSFMCKPIAHLYNKPGKIRYMSPELFQNQAWDAFKNDIFSLGVSLPRAHAKRCQGASDGECVGKRRGRRCLLTCSFFVLFRR